MNRLRIGVILPDAEPPIWAARMLEQIHDSIHAEIVAVVFAEAAKGGSPVSNRLRQLHDRLDKRAFRPTSPSPWEREDIHKIISSARLPGDTLNEQIQRLKALRLDVVLNLSLDDLPESLPAIPRYGVWSLRCNDGRVRTGADFGWLELLRGEALIHCVVEAQLGTSVQAVARSVAATDPRSFTQNQKTFLWRAASLVPYALKQLYSQGEREFFSGAQALKPASKISSPTPEETLTLAAKQAFIFTRNKLLKPWLKDRWALMVRVGSGKDQLSWDGFKPIVPPRSAFWADPFVVERQGKTYIFFEELIYKTGLGHISYVEVDRDGHIGEPQTVLEKPYHLSYPFIFEYRGEHYMIPESAQNRAIEMHHCVRFPDRWEHHRTLMQDVRAVDTTLVEHAGLWWMFVNMAGEGGSTWDELHLFYADDPLSANWTPHPMNPIVSDVRCARPAGRLFHRDGDLLRPSQDSSLRYGYALNLNRITKLTKAEYAEELIERLEPPKDGNILAVHTYNFSENLTVVDAILRK